MKKLLVCAVALAMFPALAIQIHGGRLMGASLAGPSSADASVSSSPVVFSAQRVIDEQRAGGEPVIAVLPSGTILIGAHPGWTHASRADPNLALGANGQAFLWRSADGGESFERVTLLGGDVGAAPGLANLPINECVPGISDPDLAVTAEGIAYFLDFYARGMNVMRSVDDGATWECRNESDNASRRGMDRPWLAARGGDLYMSSGGVRDVLRSVDGGASFVKVGRTSCGGDIAVDGEGALYSGCAQGGVDRSADGGRTWTRFEPRAPVQLTGAGVLPEPAIDSDGNVYTAAVGYSDDRVYLSVLPRGADEFLPPVVVSDGPDVPEGTKLWPWVVAGSEGRVAIAWYGTSGPMGDESEWRVYASLVEGALSSEPAISTAVATPSVIHRGWIHSGLAVGIACDAEFECSRGDRRLGDFFEATVDASGFLQIAYADTEAVGNGGVAGMPAGISHVGYVRQTAGPSLYASAADVHWYS